MKQKYTLNIADMQLNVVADMPAEQVNKIAGILDRKMREFYLNSRYCTKNEAALLCALEFCSERLETNERLNDLQALTAKYETVLQALQERNQTLQEELEHVRSENALLRSLVSVKPSEGEAPEAAQEPAPAVPISAADFFAEVANATEGSTTEADAQEAPADKEDTLPSPPPADTPSTAEPHLSAREEADAKRRIRRGTMFDLLSFDDEDN